MRDLLFPFGSIYLTPGAVALFESTDEPIVERTRVLEQHLSGDWGVVDANDKRANNAALKHGTRLVSAYIVGGEKVWIITEADRSVTTILLPSEY